MLISGRGSNLQALLDARQDAYEIVVVIANNPDAAGLERARAAGVEAFAIDHRPFGKNREAFEREVDA
ncbi:MAG TPA: formyltransferase family protein, partial [Caulobacterales bacterium]|nr:formyltransferase family protein [Caulobacterales bacterium]